MMPIEKIATDKPEAAPNNVLLAPDKLRPVAEQRHAIVCIMMIFLLLF